jgi:FAD/FMN-containing dehydrogenase
MARVIAARDHGDDPGPHRRWAEQTSSALARTALSGGYVAHLGSDTPEQVTHAFGPNAARLREIKQTVDPDGVFRSTPLPPA